MKHLILNRWLFVLPAIAGIAASAGELAWHTDLAEAQAQAGREHKSVLLVFHGSDWCPPCIEMQRQVFQSPKFIAWARQAVVLVDVDFPETAKQSEDQKRANAALKARFNIGENYPTLALLNEAGETVFQETGYFGGGPAEVLTKLQRHAKPPESTAGPAGFKNVSVEEFAQLAADKQNVILDVRTRQEFNAGHLAGALNLDINATDFEQRLKKLDKSKTYLVHCASGGRSARACEKLSKLDFPSLYNLSGGIRAWSKAGQPVER